MSLSQLSLPSIDHVLEGQVRSDEQHTIIQEESAASTASTSSIASLTPTLVTQPNLMKTIDLRGNDLESAEVEIYSFIVGFPDDGACTDADKDDAPTIFEERQEPVVIAEPVIVEEAEEPAPAAPWFRINFAHWIATVRRLFPIRLTGFFLRKELAQR
ncbi:hypothetical protein CVT26_015648 [Gymnopilus dilepis]|uniref:Uncharacterized protein n=1 Tax=Gymnopilus dilepis TaxID=231916 RepID=A0A409VF93_9AGAR|nr:hypothetical protein CVT26_015648 [Gymnopilus dilepis]